MIGVQERLRGLWYAGVDLVFERVCAACKGMLRGGDRDVAVCALCWSRVRSLPKPSCVRCETPRAPRGGDCPGCAELEPAITTLRSAFLHDGPSRRIVHALKYGGWSCVAEPMAHRMAAAASGVALDEIAVIVPVPTTPARRRERGYDQARILADGVGAHLRLPVDPDRLRRVRSTPPQARLHREARLRNVAGAFVARAEDVQGIGEHVMLVDDVWTTGATATACATALVRVGVRAVTVLTFARVLPELD